MKKFLKGLVIAFLAVVAALMWRDAEAAKQPVVVVYPTPPAAVILSAPTPGAEWWVTPAAESGRSAARYAVEPTAPPQKNADKEAHELVSKAELMVRGLVKEVKEATGKDNNK